MSKPEKVSKPLLTFDGNIHLNPDTVSSMEFDHKTVTMMGKAHTGKSTFLNLMVSDLSGENEAIFEANQSIDHMMSIRSGRKHLYHPIIVTSS
jgi:septin family protein